MATADELIVRIKGDLSDITKKLKQLEQSTATTTKKVSTNFNKIASVAKLAVGAVVVQQLARGASALVRFASHVEEMQAKSSVVFGQFATQVRSQLSKFGDEVGRSTFQLEEMASQIQDTFVPMGFARGEASQLSVQLTKLATDVASFNNASDVDTMRAFQSALVGNHETVRRFGVVITEATLSQELMRMGINKLSKDATNQEKVQARLNLLLAGTTDAQGDAARTSESFANQMKGLGAALSNLGVAVMTPLLPQLAEFVGMLKAGVVSIKEFLYNTGILSRNLSLNSEATKELIQAEEKLFELRRQQALHEQNTRLPEAGAGALSSAERRVRNINKQIRANDMLAKIQERQARVADEYNQKLRARGEAESTINAAIAKAKAEQEALKEQIKATTQSQREGIKATSELTSEFMTMGEGGDKLKKELADIVAENHKLKSSMKELGDTTETTNERLDNAKSIVESLKTPLEQLNEDIADLKFAQSNFTSEEFTGAMKEMEMQIRMTNPEFVMFKDALEDMGKSVSQSLAEMVVNGKGSLTSFLNIFKDFIKQLLAKTIELAIINRAINSILRLEGTTAELPTLPARASGGTVQRGRPYMVGERGPEMFVPNTGGRIVPNGALPKGGGTTVVNQNLNFTTGIQNTVRAEVLSMLPAIQESTLQAVVDQKRRGGSFGQLMT
tara:strand:- start:1326 stop:3356 length:2031 start_codon:yes stop_codon:yes gene_type:complete